MNNLWVNFQEKADPNKRGEQFFHFQDRYYRLTIWNNENFIILDMTDAGKRGKTCKELSINSYNAPHFAYWNDLLSHNLYDLFVATTEEKLPEYLKFDHFKYFFREKESKRVFPLDLNVIKSLKKSPVKWTIPNSIRAIVNNQVRELECNYRYLDDTGEDFGKGKIVNRIKFARQIFEEPSGWWTHEQRDGLVSICCHTFDSNSFIPNIKE